MASCKHIRLWASLFNGARGRGFSTQSEQSQVRSSRPYSLEGTVADEVIRALQPHVNDGGKPLLTILTKSLREERVLLEREREKDRELLQKERELLEKEMEEMEKVKELLQKDKDLLEKERVFLHRLHEMDNELLWRLQIDLLKARGLNNTRGLFECLQGNLAGKCNISPGLKGAALWEAILKANAGLAACIQKRTNVRASHVAKQALNCYNVFSILSQHANAGKSLADLQVGGGGTIKFERGPLSPKQVQVLLCIGAAARVALVEESA